MSDESPDASEATLDEELEVLTDIVCKLAKLVMEMRSRELAFERRVEWLERIHRGWSVGSTQPETEQSDD